MDDFFENLLHESNPLLFRNSEIEQKKLTFESDGVIHSTTEQIYTEIIDDVIFGLLFQIHRASKLGYLFLLDPEVGPEFDKQYEIYDENDVLGVFSNLNENYKPPGNGGRNGHGPSSANNQLLKYECVCPNCGRSLAAIRFAPHLEKCMGMGRNSSRIATRRIANYNGDELDQLIETTGLLPNRYVEHPKTVPSANTTHNDDLASIINAVATASTASARINDGTQFSSSNNSDVDFSSSSSFATNLKPPTAKKKRLQNNKSNSMPAAKPIAQVQISISSGSVEMNNTAVNHMQQNSNSSSN